MEAKLRETFATFGIPEQVVCDNGPNLVAKSLKNFYRYNGIKIITAPAYHPRSNGAAENMVKTFKNKIKTALDDRSNVSTSLNTLVNRFLMSYKNMVHCATIKTPAELIIRGKVRTRMQMLTESAKDNERNEESQRITAQNNQIKYYGGRKRQLIVGKTVMIRSYTDKQKKGGKRHVS